MSAKATVSSRRRSRPWNAPSVAQVGNDGLVETSFTAMERAERRSGRQTWTGAIRRPRVTDGARSLPTAVGMVDSYDVEMVTKLVMNDAIVLCYHALSPTWEAALSTTPAQFERQISLLVARGYRGVTFTAATGFRGRGRVMAVTFDDAYRSVFECALPILEQYRLPATVFAPTDYIGTEQPMRWPGIDRWLGGPDEAELVPMSWEQLGTLAELGWEIGSHTVSHPRLTLTDDVTLADELSRSKAACEEHLRCACESLAYPYGDVDGRVVAAAARAGYSAAAALPTNLSSQDVLAWPRIGVYQTDGDRRFRLKVSPAVRGLRSSWLWDHLDALRRVSGRL